MTGPSILDIVDKELIRLGYVTTRLVDCASIIAIKPTTFIGAYMADKHAVVISISTGMDKQSSSLDSRYEFKICDPSLMQKIRDVCEQP